MIKGNKGEWSELYVLLRLLAYGKIYAADDQVKKIENVYFPILKIMREEVKGKKLEYRIGTNEDIEIYNNDIKIKSVSREQLKKEADYLYNEIVNILSKKLDNITFKNTLQMLLSVIVLQHHLVTKQILQCKSMTYIQDLSQYVGLVLNRN